MVMVYAIHRIQRRDEKNRRHSIPAKGCFECSGKEYDHLMNAGAIRHATKAEIAAAEDDKSLHPQKRMARARTLRELRALKAAKEFKPEDYNPDEDNGPEDDDNGPEEGGKKEQQAKAPQGKAPQGKGGKKNLV